MKREQYSCDWCGKEFDLAGIKEVPLKFNSNKEEKFYDMCRSCVKNILMYAIDSKVLGEPYLNKD